MDEATLNEAGGWLRKARSDLASARKLASGSDPYLDTAIYHCQQAAEKALTIFLSYHAQPFGKTHDLRVLIAQASTLEAGFRSWQDAADRLTPLGTEFRYPGGILKPDREEFDTALGFADGIVSFATSLLPKDIHLTPGQS